MIEGGEVGLAVDETAKEDRSACECDWGNDNVIVIHINLQKKRGDNTIYSDHRHLIKT